MQIIFMGTQLMRWRLFYSILGGILMLVACAPGAMALSPCDFAPAKSLLVQGNAQGAFQLYDDPHRDDRDNLATGNIEASFTHLRDTESFGYRVDGHAKAEFLAAGADVELRGAGSAKQFISGDRFLLGAVDMNGKFGWETAPSLPLDIDLTGGLGIGRFRDVTPLAKAIRIQNTFLDQGILQGPFTDDKLQELAKILSKQDMSLPEKIESLEAAMEATGLASGGSLGARALLQLEDIITGQGEARLCGWELQASVGLNLSELPPTEIHETLVLNWNYALVPDPVTQWTANARFASGFDLFSRYSVRASVAMGRRLAENLRVRASYSFTRDPVKEIITDRFIDKHQLTTTVFFQVTNRLSLTINGELGHETGFEQLSRRLDIQLSYGIF